MRAAAVMPFGPGGGLRTIVSAMHRCLTLILLAGLAGGAGCARSQPFVTPQRLDLLVICDDLNLPLAKLRFRAEGSSGGQKGLGDIIRRLGTETFARLRIGIGPPPEDRDHADFVLNKFSKEEIPIIEEAVWRAADAAAAWACEGIQHCMNQYNAG